MVSLPLAFLTLFVRSIERVISQILHDSRVVRGRWKHLVAFPTAQRYRADPKPASRFRLEDFDLEPASSQVAAKGGWLFWNWYATIVGW